MKFPIKSYNNMPMSSLFMHILGEEIVFWDIFVTVIISILQNFQQTSVVSYYVSPIEETPVLNVKIIWLLILIILNILYVEFEFLSDTRYLIWMKYKVYQFWIFLHVTWNFKSWDSEPTNTEQSNFCFYYFSASYHFNFNMLNYICNFKLWTNWQKIKQ